ncbi:MAG: aromatic ring-hydroxylating dioxygenase subunit alpha [Hyphomicrobiales bacterium]|nr:aromatic ring-hydroxylating dioxygenase subunit alpha [Hyphomicrobiales bacterium]
MPTNAEQRFDWTMPASLYRDPQHFERERQSIFATNWGLFTWSARVGKPGDYVSGILAGYSIFVMRGDDGVLRGFHNVCRHRGATLLSKESGDCGKLLVCPYHSWSYGRDGHLAKATDFGGEVEFDAKQWGLLEIDVEEWRGLVFCRIRRGGQDLKSWLGPIDAMAADYPLETQEHFLTCDREVEVDWKAYGENYLECYHCRAMHPGLCAAMDIDRYTIDVHREGGFFHLYAPRRKGGLTRGLYFYRFPYLMLNLYDWGSSIATIEPLGAGRIRHINWYFFQDVSPEKADENKRSADWSAQIVTEDLAILLGVQRNLNAGVYDRGPLSPKYEHAVKAFQRMVRDALGDGGGGLRVAAE